jgi:hypothetical protein
MANDAAIKKLGCLEQIFGAANCTGQCIYKWNPNLDQYVLQPGSSCSGGTGCPNCAQVQGAEVHAVVVLLGKSCYPDPANISVNCGLNTQVVVSTVLKAIKYHKLLVKLAIGLGAVSVLSIGGAAYLFFTR